MLAGIIEEISGSFLRGIRKKNPEGLTKGILVETVLRIPGGILGEVLGIMPGEILREFPSDINIEKNALKLFMAESLEESLLHTLLKSVRVSGEIRRECPRRVPGIIPEEISGGILAGTVVRGFFLHFFMVIQLSDIIPPKVDNGFPQFLHTIIVSMYVGSRVEVKIKTISFDISQ